MGNLHAGHLDLMHRARAAAARLVVSIFVNPLQFGQQADLEAYPRTMATDSAQLAAVGCDCVFLPGVADIYPRGMRETTQVWVPGLSEILCGVFRPGHFVGVTTVVIRLFNLVRPHSAVFGEKDFQQLLVIRRMVADLFLPVDILAAPTVREDDGLAMSSRNAYLSPQERLVAPKLYQTLCELSDLMMREGRRDCPALEAGAIDALAAAGFRPEYTSIRRSADLGIPAPGERELRVLAAAWLGRARLIDNVRIDLPN
jgi:pantoate--beta-alanine ligase